MDNIWTESEGIEFECRFFCLHLSSGRRDGQTVRLPPSATTIWRRRRMPLCVSAPAFGYDFHCPNPPGARSLPRNRRESSEIPGKNAYRWNALC